MSKVNVASPSGNAAAATPVASGTASAPPSSQPKTTSSNSGAPMQLLTRSKLQDLIKEVDPNEQLDEDVEDILLQSTDGFVDFLVSKACDVAKHRKSSALEIQDLQLVLDRQLNMFIPGYGVPEDGRPPKKSHVTEAHKQRMAVIRKTLKK